MPDFDPAAAPAETLIPQPMTMAAHALSCTGWIYGESDVLPVAPAGAGITVEVLQNNDRSHPDNPARWGQETNLDTWAVDPSCPNHYTRIRYLVPGPRDVVQLRIENVHDPASPELVYQDAELHVPCHPSLWECL